ncbi:MAG: aminotransferase class V-fold PLP-dependent enzyme [Lysobacterales bacterium]|nr:MAG: aminotransferase class V-fold PLP-dependent enzyme [Xanthomonadales bacterium]
MRDNYYFDNAATSWPKPEVVYTTMDQFFRNFGVNPGRAGHELAVEAEKMIEETRRLLAAFFDYGGDPHRVVFTQNATDSLNIAFFGLLESGDHVVTTRLEHNSVLRPLAHLSRDNGVEVTYVERDGQGYVDPDNIRSAITAKTRMVVVNHASNVLGSVQDLEAIGRVSREAGTLFVVDTCQSAGVLPIRMDAWGIDIVTFTGHKSLFGPMGIGGMIVREDLNVRPFRVGGTGVDSIDPYQPEMYPYHLEAGTVALPGIAGLNAAQKWFASLGREQAGESGAGMSHTEACRAALGHISDLEQRHVSRLASAFRDVNGIKVYGPVGNRPRVATLSINVGDLPADQTGAILDGDYHVCVRAGLHCAPLVHKDEKTVAQNGAVRFSPGYFTDDEDIEQAITAVTEIASFSSAA